MKEHAFHPGPLNRSNASSEESGRAVKMPLYLTSNFFFHTAEEGKEIFRQIYAEDQEAGSTPMVYSRLNNPNLEVLEQRMADLDGADTSLVFSSGMAAISTVMLAMLKPGDLLLCGAPVYGGTFHLIDEVLRRMDIQCIFFSSSQDREEIITRVEASGRSHRLRLIFLETPSNPTQDLFDIRMCRQIADYFGNADGSVAVVVDNTFMGPLWSKPLQHGADLVVYSATKYLGGHSDLLAGVVSGSSSMIRSLHGMRTLMGNMATPHTCWLLLRSLETLKVRMDAQCRGAIRVARMLHDHPMVEEIRYPLFLDRESRAGKIYSKQYNAPGAMISFYLRGSEEIAFRFLNRLRFIRLAVSLGGTESLVQHPASMTHAGLDDSWDEIAPVPDNLIRLSVGLEDPDDLIADLQQALSGVNKPSMSTKKLSIHG